MTVVAQRFGVSGAAFDTVRRAFASPTQTRTASGVVGILITVAFAVSFTTALQRVFLRAWRRPPGGGARNKARGAIWLGALLVFSMVVAGARAVLHGPGRVGAGLGGRIAGVHVVVVVDGPADGPR